MNKNKLLCIMFTGLTVLLASGSTFADGRHHRYDKRIDRAVTNWLVVINYPEACSGTPCSEADIFGSVFVEGVDNNPTKATVCYLTGQVVQKNGKATFAGALGEGDSSGCFFPGFDDADPHALKDSMRAEIHVIVQEHGKPLELGYGLEDQLTMNLGGCNPDCTDTQFAIHVPAAAVGGVSSTAVHRFADESVVYGAESLLIRDREGVRVVTKTKLDDAY